MVRAVYLLFLRPCHRSTGRIVHLQTAKRSYTRPKIRLWTLTRVLVVVARSPGEAIAPVNTTSTMTKHHGRQWQPVRTMRLCESFKTLSWACSRTLTLCRLIASIICSKCESLYPLERGLLCCLGFISNYHALASLYRNSTHINFTI